MGVAKKESISKLIPALVVRPHSELAKRTVPPVAFPPRDRHEHDEEDEPKSGTFLVDDRSK